MTTDLFTILVRYSHKAKTTRAGTNGTKLRLVTSNKSWIDGKGYLVGAASAFRNMFYPALMEKSVGSGQSFCQSDQDIHRV